MNHPSIFTVTSATLRPLTLAILPLGVPHISLTYHPAIVAPRPLIHIAVAR